MRTVFKNPIAIVVWALALMLSGPRAARAAVGEYPLKAAFLYNFAQFVEWPASSFANDPKAPLIIAILGDDVFNGALERTMAGKTVGTHPVLVRRYPTADDVKPCHILFVSSGAQDQFRAAQQKLGGNSVLWVGESDDFASIGGMVQFYTEENHMRFAIRRAVADKAGLHISAKLLKLAKIVDG